MRVFCIRRGRDFFRGWGRGEVGEILLDKGVFIMVWEG